jgi:hypothetical protein
MQKVILRYLPALVLLCARGESSESSESMLSVFKEVGSEKEEKVVKFSFTKIILIETYFSNTCTYTLIFIRLPAAWRLFKGPHDARLFSKQIPVNLPSQIWAHPDIHTIFTRGPSPSMPCGIPHNFQKVVGCSSQFSYRPNPVQNYLIWDLQCYNPIMNTVLNTPGLQLEVPAYPRSTNWNVCLHTSPFGGTKGLHFRTAICPNINMYYIGCSM